VIAEGTDIYSAPSAPQENILAVKRLEEERISMALKLTNREVNGVTVVELDGRIVLGEETNKLRDTVKSLVSQGKKKLVLDVKNVTTIDSSGLGALVAAYSTAKSSGASLRLSNLGAHFNQLLQITRLLTVFEVSKTQEDAIAAFSKSQVSAV
jgi:anti-sigma B factor antagonist